MAATQFPDGRSGKKAATCMAKKNIDEAFEHPSADKTTRHSMDQALRAHGFVIWSRPKTGPVLWSTPILRHKGKTWTEDEAISMMLQKELPTE